MRRYWWGWDFALGHGREGGRETESQRERRKGREEGAREAEGEREEEGDIVLQVLLRSRFDQRLHYLDVSVVCSKPQGTPSVLPPAGGA